MRNHLSLVTAFVIASGPLAPVIKAGCTVTSSDGYSVNIDVTLQQLVPTGSNCQWGYNYNVRFNYTISIVGHNAPSSLYDLQGNIFCGSQQLWFSLPKSTSSGTLITTSSPWSSRNDCRTATLGSMGCTSLRIQLSGRGISSRTIECSVAILPVEYVDFSGDALSDAVRLDWSTASERDSESFQIERSIDMLAFETIGHVNAQGNSSRPSHYAYTDHGPATGTNYYRLKQLDRNGSSTYSAIIPVAFERGERTVLFPNPGNGQQVHFRTGWSGPYVVRIHRSDGSEMGRLLAEDNSPLDLPYLPPGVYILSLEDLAGHTRMQRYVQL